MYIKTSGHTTYEFYLPIIPRRSWRRRRKWTKDVSRRCREKGIERALKCMKTGSTSRRINESQTRATRRHCSSPTRQHQALNPAQCALWEVWEPGLFLRAGEGRWLKPHGRGHGISAGATCPKRQGQEPPDDPHARQPLTDFAVPAVRACLEDPPPRIWKTHTLLLADKPKCDILCKKKGKKCVSTSVYICLEGKTEMIMRK